MTITGKNLAGFEQFKDACGVAGDAQGNVYVADYYQNRILVFNSDGEPLKRILNVEPPAGPGLPPLDGPCDLAVDASGNLYVNNWHRNVVKFTPSPPPPISVNTTYGSGAVIDSNHPTSVALDPGSGNLFVDDRTYVAEYEAPVLAGEGPARKIGLGSLGSGYGVAVSGFHGSPGVPSTDNWIYVADAVDDTIKVYDPGTSLVTPIQVIGGGGTPHDGFHLTDADLAVDPSDGHLYVTDNLEPGLEHPELAVDELSALGFYRGILPLPKSEGGPTLKVNAVPTGVAVAADGKILVTSGDYEDAEVIVFDAAPPLQTRFLTADKLGSGSGTVARFPSGWLRCGQACKAELDFDSSQEFVAIPDAHNRFVGWSGDCEKVIGNRCALAMTDDKAIAAEFEPIPQRTLGVAVSGGGAGTVTSTPAGIDCAASCHAEFDEGTVTGLTATAAPGSQFVGWSGCDTQPAANVCNVTMSAARSVVAQFEPVPPPPPPPAPGPRTLSVSAATLGDAAGTVTSEPAGLDCGGICSRPFDFGAVVTLIAHPAPGSTLVGWGGCDAAHGNRCSIRLAVDRTVVAAFGPGQPGPLRLRRLDVRATTATLTVTVPTAGSLRATGSKLAPASALPLAAGNITLRLRLSHAGRRALKRSKSSRLAVRVALSFTPFDGGGQVEASRVVKFAR